MQTPELLLSELNQAIRELRGAARVLDNADIDAQLLPVMRRLTLAEIMNNRWLIAVGGTQSAGKTTLVRTLYGLQNNDPWLPPNEGQGETLPVLIEESSDHETPKGYAIVLRPAAEGSTQFIMDEKELQAAEFVKACRGRLSDVLLPVLRVPRRHFQHEGQALLLLPGYEKCTPKNETWQNLMRQALVGAAGCVIVTDATRMASQVQQEIVKDMLANELRTIKPLVVIAKTESLGNDEGRLEELRQTAVAGFELKGEDAARQVFCAGTASDCLPRWLPAFVSALRDMSLSGTASRQVQLAKLEQTLSEDLTNVLKEVRTHATLFFRGSGGDDGGPETLKNCLDAFDEACASLRDRHQLMVKNLTGEHYGKAWEEMQDRLERDHEGLWNKLTGTFDSVTETQRKLERDVLGAWHSPGSVLAQYTAGLGQLTEKAAGPDLPQGTLPSTAPLLLRLGYVDDKNKLVPSKFTDEKVQMNLRALMQSRAGEVSTGVTNRDLEKTARLLPVMALEYTRIASALSELVQVSEVTLEKLPQADLAKSVDNVKQQFTDFSDATRGILKGIAAVMAVDVAADGHADIINELLAAVGMGTGGTAAGGAGTAASTAGLTVGGAVAAVVAIGFIAHSAMQEVKRYDTQVRSLANNMLQNTREHHQVHFSARYDELMATVRSHLKQGLRRRYGLDQRLMEQDRLAKALADVRVLQRDLLSQLSQSGQTLALFEKAAA
jgi:hypothetical protein